MLINLHTHLEGCVRPSTASELAGELRLGSPTGGWGKALQLDGPVILTTYLAKVAATHPFFTTSDYIARLACEALEDAASDGVDYLELRFGPATHTSRKLSLDQVVRAVCRGIAEGTSRTGMPAGAVVCALRHHDASTNNAVARTAARFAGSGVVGFDLAGDEILYPDLEPYAESFRIAGASGLGLTCHAAETAPGTAARDAVRLFGVTRIGHGVHIASSPEVMRWCRDEGIVIECCPTSNWLTGGVTRLTAHPIRAFRDSSVAVALGDDNPRQTTSSLSSEYEILKTQLDFTAEDLSDLDRTSVRAAFADGSTRDLLSKKLTACS